jgi:Ca-activated chloride channel homolog
MRFWWLLLVLPDVALARTESWPQLYNSGVTAYRSNDFAHAAALFENATSSTDRALQQRALYNFGNTSYRLGQAQPAQAQPLWQRALTSYETALALDPTDADAKFNHDLVKKKLEELKQQQQQQNQKHQEDKKQDQKKNDEQQQRQQNQQQNKPDDKQSDQQQQSQQSQEQQNQEQEQKDQQEKQQKDQQQAQQQKPEEPEQPPQENGGQLQNYDKMRAAAMLDNLREDERNWNFFPEVQMKDLKNSGEPAKDW